MNPEYGREPRPNAQPIVSWEEVLWIPREIEAISSETFFAVEAAPHQNSKAPEVIEHLEYFRMYGNAIATSPQHPVKDISISPPLISDKDQKPIKEKAPGIIGGFKIGIKKLWNLYLESAGFRGGMSPEEIIAEINFRQYRQRGL